MAASLPLLELTRGRLVESVHHGSIAVVDSSGKLIANHGDPHLVAFLRSSAKPFQALPFTEHGGVEQYEYTPRELALSCASHDGGRIHLDTVREMQKKVGIQEKDLQCGGHLPNDPEMFREFVCTGIKPTSNHNNCSGKHTTMLAYAKMRGFSLTDYLDIEHPMQQEILTTLCEMCSIEREKVEIGIDGCSAPNFAMPLYHAAFGMARLCDPWDQKEARATACRKITSAMTSHSEMVSNHGEFDCELMKIGRGQVVTKRGAEGFQIMGLIPTSQQERGIGIAFKVTDGDASRMNDALESTSRVRPAVTLEILRQLGALDDIQLKGLEKFGPEKKQKNFAGIITGKSHPVFKLSQISQ
jgi:L-asparaginase II